MKLKSIIVVGLLVVATNANAGGGGVGAVAGATLPEQLVQSLTMADQLVKQGLMVQQQLSMLQSQAKNLAGLPSQMWPGVSGQLNQLILITRQAQNLAYNGGDMVASVQRQYGTASQTLANASASYRSWVANDNQQLANTLQSYGMQSDNFASEQDALASVQTASQSATGRMQALQAGNAIAGMQVNQLQLLRSAVMQGNSAMLSATATQNNQHVQERNIQEDWMKIPPKRGVW